MNPFDLAIMQMLSQYAQRSYTFDELVVHLLRLEFFKGGLMLSLLWWLWFNDAPNRLYRREIIVATISACLMTLAIVRVLTMVLPFRERPYFNTAAALIMPYTTEAAIPVMEKWSAFPSDHAAMFFALALGVWLCSRPLGFWAFLHATLIISLPRIYTGLHHPTDIVAGAMIGMFCVWLGCHPRVIAYVKQKITRIQNYLMQHPAWFYTIFFTLSYEMIVLFSEVRILGRLAYAILKRAIAQ